MDIKVIGKNSSNRIKLLKNLNKVKKQFKFEIEILDDDKTIEKYQNIPTPILVINDRIVSNGKSLSDKEIKKFIRILV